MRHERSILDVTEWEREQVIQYAPVRCYRDIASELNVPVNTVKRIVRTHIRQVQGQK